jgi:hypothetical protein
MHAAKKTIYAALHVSTHSCRHTHRLTCCCGREALPHGFSNLIHPLLPRGSKLCQRTLEQLQGRLLGGVAAGQGEGQQADC